MYRDFDGKKNPEPVNFLNIPYDNIDLTIPEEIHTPKKKMEKNKSQFHGIINTTNGTPSKNK